MKPVNMVALGDFEGTGQTDRHCDLLVRARGKAPRGHLAKGERGEQNGVGRSSVPRAPSNAWEELSLPQAHRRGSGDAIGHRLTISTTWGQTLLFGFSSKILPSVLRNEISRNFA